MREETRSAHGELSVAKNTPILQASSADGITSAVSYVAGGTSAFEIEDGLFKLTAGGVGSSTFFNTSDIIVNKPGQGMLARFNMGVTLDGAPPIAIGAGLLNIISTIAIILYDGTPAIFATTDAAAQVEELEMTAGSGGAETGVLTLSNVIYNIPLAAGTAADNAWDIAAWWEINGTTDWLMDAVADKITIRKRDSIAANGTFSFSSAGTAAGTFTQLAPSKTTIPTIILQSDWDNPRLWRGFTLEAVQECAIECNFSNGNVRYFIMNPTTSEYVLVHTLKIAGAMLASFTDTPNYAVGGIALGGGATGASSLHVGTLAGFTQGEILPVAADKSVANEGITDADVSPLLLSLRNSYTTHDTENLVPLIPKSVQVYSSDTPMRVKVYKNAVVIGDATIRPNFQLVDDSEVAETDVVANVLTPAGSPIKYGYTGNSGTSAGLADINLEDLNLNILPGDTFHVVGEFVGTMAPGTLIDAVITYEEA